MPGILAIMVSLALLMFFAYRGVTVLLLAPIMAALAVLLSGDAMQLLPIYTDTFMRALGNYVIQFLPIFLLGALFGQLMADSGAANTIAQAITRRLGHRHAILTVVLACAVLTYGGVSLFVVAFAIYPIAKALFRAADVPKRLIPATIALGAFTFTMTAMPGTPAIQNAIPIPFFGTNVFAAPGLGLIGSAIMLVGGMAWLRSRATRARADGEGYGVHEDDGAQAPAEGAERGGLSVMPLALAVLPLLLVIGINALFTYGIFPRMDFAFMQASFPNVDPAKTTGLWALIIALAVACLTLVLVRLGKWENLRESVNKGVFGFMLPLFNTASEVGYGAVIAGLAGFALIRDAVLNVSPNNPLISEAVAMNVLAGITGSSSGGLSIALQTLGAEYLAMAEQVGMSPELLHRVAVMAAGGMDTLPHCGAIITLLAICKLNHRQSYANIAMVTMVAPLVALITVITLGTLFGSF
ncbi:GntP family permease [Achromobacter sp. GG226]|uniref:GntP family permease n=1 Tax=Verticiella alkaliphila TaxID=2779529 RepID=UPI001C0B9030|nr:GntP family permease [Verticiella sp. GG226]MBU4610138.1 GntP family permease [Verticiella sp. GG226]